MITSALARARVILRCVSFAIPSGSRVRDAPRQKNRVSRSQRTRHQTSVPTKIIANLLSLSYADTLLGFVGTVLALAIAISLLSTVVSDAWMRIQDARRG